MRRLSLLLMTLSILGCQRLGEVGRTPSFTPVEDTNEYFAMNTIPMPEMPEDRSPVAQASLWSGTPKSLLGDRRAARKGDIMTVVIEIDDSAKFSNSSDRSRTESQSMGIPSLFGIPEQINKSLPEGASMASAVSTNSNSSFAGDGNVSRNEQLTLRVAATIIDVLPNGVLRVQGSQEVRVNYEVRELIVTGYVRPEDISRQNEITYDKIAGARISYGGRGQISDVQQPRIGSQIADIVMPF
ncbi:flagellar basal body L-ring protein FlgH [Thioclava sp. GXIMD4216]|uniref:Flagellar L-ring protein n=1 Tax=Thioclava litoralis TaxID=3076557 RepID=A0ABZ1DXZ4_9RHOB|nr:flagellar basal body L-ring protein FlgH [Thioclava sp. FTW29]